MCEVSEPRLQIPMASLNNFVGKRLGVSEWVKIDQDKIDQFAACTGDRQWIHVDARRAKNDSPFKRTIAHGYLTLSLIAPLSFDMGIVPSDAEAVLNYGLDKVRFISPVKSGQRVRMQLYLEGLDYRENGQILMRTKATLDIENSESPALIAETLTLIIPKAMGTHVDADQGPRPPTTKTPMRWLKAIFEGLSA
jgi:acyl dehydratase